MYEKFTHRASRAARRVVQGAALAATTVLALGSQAHGQLADQVVRTISHANERLEMTVNTSQILTLGTRIPRMVVNNPEIVTATPLSETQVQIAARKPGVTQINLWDENGKVYTVDLLIFGDVRELEMALKQMFPGSTLKVVRLTNSLVLEGQVDRPEIVSTIRTLAEDYAPKVVNNITVGGVQQIMLKVKVMEVSRTKLRRLGFDWVFTNNGDFITSGVAGLLTPFTSGTQNAVVAGHNVSFGIVDDNGGFFGFIQALQQNNIAKIMADPTLTTVSGRPASFNVGGELPILVPSGLGTTSIEYKKFGTQVDFVPIVLGDGNIRLEVRPRISEIDDTRSVTVNSFTVPALKVREVDTGVELKAGQTLALAGLIQTRVDAVQRGFPVLVDMPGIGAAFRRVEEQVNEIELLILVTPEYVDAMDPGEVPMCGPGMETMSPSHTQLYWKGMIEVPACGPCGAANCCSCNAPGLACGPNGCNACNAGYPPQMPSGVPAMATDAGYESPPINATEPSLAPEPAESIMPNAPAETAPSGLNLPDPSADNWQAAPQPEGADPAYADIRPAAASIPATSTPGLIGPIGYDVQK